MISESKIIEPYIYIGHLNKVNAKKLIPDNKKVIALAPTANWGGKQWPAENFIEFISSVSGEKGRIKNSIVAIFGLESENHMIRPLLEYLKNIDHINLIGKTSILDAYACMQRCIGFVGNDSGLMHLAAAANINTLGLFGPSKEINYRPWGDRSYFLRTESDYEDLVNVKGYSRHHSSSLMKSLTVEKVFRKVSNFSCTDYHR